MSVADEPATDERRRSPRVRVNEVVQFQAEGRRVVGLLSVINDAGFFVTTRHFLDLGSITDFEIDLPEAGRFLHVTGQVALINGPKRYDWRMPIGMGVRFLSMDDVTRNIIDSFLSKAIAAGAVDHSDSGG